VMRRASASSSTIVHFATANDRSQCTFQITPWRDADEFEAVGELLLSAGSTIDVSAFSSSLVDGSTQEVQIQINLIRHALRQVIVWRTRSAYNQLPYTIESTACLAELLVHDYDSSTAASLSTQMSLRLAYSSAVIRAVNGIANSLQQRRGLDRANALSVATLCRRMGLPGWVVDMRHDAAHGELPTLPCLRMAAKTLLEFFSTFYWKPLSDSRKILREKAINALLLYKQSATKQSKAGFVGIINDQEETSSFIPPTTIANEFVSLLPMEVGIPLAVDVLIHGTEVSTSDIECFLIPRSGEFPDTEAGFLKVSQIYKPLLITVQQSWPGFFHALIVQAVDSIVTKAKKGDEMCLASEGGKSFIANQRDLFFLMSWVRFLTSQTFLLEIKSSLKSSTKKPPPPSFTQSKNKKKQKFLTTGSAVTTSKELMKQFNVPIRTICDHLSEDRHKHGNEISQLLSFLVIQSSANIDEKKKSSVQNPKKKIPSEDTSICEGTVCAAEDKAAVASSLLPPVSLEAIEAMLQTDHDGEESSFSVRACSDSAKVCDEVGKVQHVEWSQCQSWDACAIGSLPGRPLSHTFVSRIARNSV